VYPNPFDNKIFIKGEFKGALVEIADLYGKVVYSAPFTQPEINLPLLSAGFYVVSVKEGKRVFQQKLLKK
ncbi:MAG TPA: T9SS type A sorting domain-containing protein, partial [Prolixibacteraceae bacterium]|nr:T9SS type A sorting domain-containing protein [Prolixibacteraceae bacterium]